MDWCGRLKQEWRLDGLRIIGSEAFPASNLLEIDFENLETLLAWARKTPEGLLDEFFPTGG